MPQDIPNRREKQESILSPKDLDWSGEPEVAQLYFDWHDRGEEDTVRVWVVVPDDTNEERLIWPEVEPLEDAISEALRREHPELVPIVIYRTESEFAEERGREQ